MIFYIEFYYNSVEKILFGLKSDKTMRHFAFHLVLSLEETPLGKIISNILAQDRNITSKGPLLHRVRMERVSPVRVPILFLCVSHLCKQI